MYSYCRCCDNVPQSGGRSWRLPMTLKAQITTEEKCWVSEEGMFNLVFHFNPQVHGELSLEFLSQIIEKYKHETIGPGYEHFMFISDICRVDYRFEIIEMTVRGQKWYREDLTDHYIGLSLMPGENILLETNTSTVASCCCLCKNSCPCVIFWTK